MKRFQPTLIWQIFMLVFTTVLLSAVFTGIVFSKTGTEALANIKSGELITRARYVADITSLYLQGRMGDRDYARALGDDRNILDAAVYACNTNGDVFLYPKYTDSPENRLIIDKYFPSLMQNNEIVDLKVITIALPVADDAGQVIGAVFLIKPIADIISALTRVTSALMCSMIIVLIVMLIFAYIASRSIAKPIAGMTNISIGMANGDFSLIAPETGNKEIAALGRSLNDLSKALHKTISDLTIERNRLKNIIDGMSDGLLTITADLEVITYNPSAARLLSGDKNSLPVLDAIREHLHVFDDKATYGDEVEFDIENDEAILHVVMSALTDEHNDYLYALVLLRDITQATRYEQARRDYVANVSHELRTPLASIRGLTDALYDGLIKTEDDKHRYYGNIIKESMRLSRLIDDLLELSRLQSGTMAFAMHSVDVYELVNDALCMFSCPQRNNTAVQITAECEEKLPVVYTNDDRAEQVLIIMIDNALKHADNGNIVIRAQKVDDSVVLSVTNEGTIDKHDLPYLFERFYKVDKAHTGNGTGLGLSIAKEIISILGERIWVENKNNLVKFCFTLSTNKPTELN